MLTTLRDAFHVLGIATIFSAVAMMCWTFYDISTQGYFILGESRLAVLYFEWGLIGFSFIYVVYLLVVFVKGKAEIKKII